MMPKTLPEVLQGAVLLLAAVMAWRAFQGARATLNQEALDGEG